MADRAETISLKREELYEQVWSKPVLQLAKRYGLSDVAIAKICKKHSIPKPPLGYWAKVTHGKTLPRPPLPGLNDERLNIVLIHKRPQRPYPVVSISPGQIIEPAIVVPERLNSPHPLVVTTLAAVKNTVAYQNRIIRPGATQCLDIAVSRDSIGRAMRIMDTLLKAWEARGHDVSITEKDKKTCVQVDANPSTSSSVNHWIGEKSNSV